MSEVSPPIDHRPVSELTTLELDEIQLAFLEQQGRAPKQRLRKWNRRPLAEWQIRERRGVFTADRVQRKRGGDERVGQGVGRDGYRRGGLPFEADAGVGDETIGRRVEGHRQRATRAD